MNGHGELVNLLLENGAEVDARNHDGITALMTSVLHGHAPTARMLISRGADVKSVDTHHRTALMFASMAGSLACIRVLLAVGARKSDRDEVGNFSRCVLATVHARAL